MKASRYPADKLKFINRDENKTSLVEVEKQECNLSSSVKDFFRKPIFIHIISSFSLFSSPCTNYYLLTCFLIVRHLMPGVSVSGLLSCKVRQQMLRGAHLHQVRKMSREYQDHLFSHKTSRAAGIRMKIHDESWDSLLISSAKASSIIKWDGNGEKIKEEVDIKDGRKVERRWSEMELSCWKVSLMFCSLHWNTTFPFITSSTSVKKN